MLVISAAVYGLGDVVGPWLHSHSRARCRRGSPGAPSVRSSSSHPQSSVPATSTPPCLTTAEASLIVALRTFLQAELTAADCQQSGSVRTCSKLWMSIQDLQEYFGLGRTAIKRMIHDGELTGIKRPCRGKGTGTFVLGTEAEQAWIRRVPSAGNSQISPVKSLGLPTILPSAPAPASKP